MAQPKENSPAGRMQRRMLASMASFYKQHQMAYASDLIECGHCGSPITGARTFKMTKSGEREYVNYRCTQYQKGDNPRIRLTENKPDQQMLSIFDTLRMADNDFRDLFRE